MSKRTRDRQLQKLAARRAAERRRKRRQRIVAGIVAGTVAVAGGSVVAIAFLGRDQEEAKPMSTPTPTAPSGEVACGGEVPAAAGQEKPTFPKPPKMEIDESKSYTAVMQTSCGAIELELFAKQTPITVNNFVFLARQGFYDGVTFHRVIPQFMIQGGDPQGTGSGGPGYQFEDEIVDDLTFTEPGLLAMANAGPGTNGSQFFITTSNPEHLNGAHTIFGRVANGMDVVSQIEAVGTPDGVPTKTAYIESVTIEEK